MFQWNRDHSHWVRIERFTDIKLIYRQKVNSGALGRVNEVTLHRVRLVLRWVTVSFRVYTVSDLPSLAGTHFSIPQRVRGWVGHGWLITYRDRMSTKRNCHPPQYYNQARRNRPPRPTQPPTLCGMGNEYRPKGSEALWPGSKYRFGSLHLLQTCGWQVKTVWSLVNTCHT